MKFASPFFFKFSFSLKHDSNKDPSPLWFMLIDFFFPRFSINIWYYMKCWHRWLCLPFLLQVNCFILTLVIFWVGTLSLCLPQWSWIRRWLKEWGARRANSTRSSVSSATRPFSISAGNSSVFLVKFIGSTIKQEWRRNERIREDVSVENSKLLWSLSVDTRICMKQSNENITALWGAWV